MAAESCPECKITTPGEECPSCGTLVAVAGEEMECPVCLNVIDSEVDLCPHCGAEFEWVDEDEDAWEEDIDYDLQCPECSNPVSISDDSCPHCGTELEFFEEEVAAPPEAPVAKPKRRFGIDLKGLFRPAAPKAPPAEEDPEEEPAAPAEGPAAAAPRPVPAGEAPEIDEDMDLDAEIERITEEEPEEEPEELELSPEMVQELFDKAVKEIGDPYDVKNPTKDYAEAVAPLMEKWSLASGMAAPLGEADRLFDETYIMAKNRQFPAAVRGAKEAEEELDRRIEDTLFYRQAVVREALRHLSEETAADAAALLDDSEEHLYSGDYAKSKLAMDAAVERVAAEKPHFKEAEELGRVLTRHLAIAERFLVDTREVRELMAHSRDYHSRGDWRSCVQVCEGALERLRPVLDRVAAQELEAMKEEMVRRKWASKVSERMIAAASDAAEFMAKGETLPALEHIFRVRSQMKEEA